MKSSHRVVLPLATALVLASVLASPGADAQLPSPRSLEAVYVSASSNAKAATCGRRSAPCKTITDGLARVKTGGVVHVEPGVYKEQVVVTKRLSLVGSYAAVDALGLSSGSGNTLDAAAILLTPSASGSSVEGFSVHGAYGEGILVMRASHVLIADNTVSGNDLGNKSNTQYLECEPQGQVPGDCGEGIHLMSATKSTVADNRVIGNSGGILITDEMGPASGNRILHNYVADNLYDCGITLPSHSTTAVSKAGVPQPSKGGVFDNLVRGNTVIGNGVIGAGAGILIAAAAPGGGSYDNRIVDNIIEGNGMPGVTIHAHAPSQDVSGNVITGNRIGPNNLVGDPDANVFVTTGILVFSAVVPVSVTLSGNRVTGDVHDVWKSRNVHVKH